MAMATAMKRVEATTSISRQRQPTLLPPPKSAHMPALHLRALQGWVGGCVGGKQAREDGGVLPAIALSPRSTSERDAARCGA